MKERDCTNCKHHTEDGCSKWNCEFERAMTREEAREILTHNWTRVDNPNYSESELDEAFFMAIDALKRMDDTDIETKDGEIRYTGENYKI